MVEFVAVEVEAADQGADRAGSRVGGEQGCFDFRHLRDAPVVLFVGLDADYCAAPQPLVGWGFVVEHARGELHAVATDREHLATTAVGSDLLGFDFEDDGRAQVRRIAEILKQHVERFVLIGLDVAHLDISFGPPVTMPPVVVEHTLAQTGVGGFLIAFEDGCIDAQTT